MRKVAYDIIWDVDDPEDVSLLPTEIEIPKRFFDEEKPLEDAIEEISDYISNVTGFCHGGFKLKDSPEKELKKYAVTVVRYGVIFVEAENKAAAMDIADHQTTDTVSWSDDWRPTDCEENIQEPDEQYVKEKAFE